MCNYSEGIWLSGVSQGLNEGRAKGQAEGVAQEQFNGISILAKTLAGVGFSLQDTITKVRSEYSNSEADIESIVGQYYPH